MSQSIDGILRDAHKRIVDEYGVVLNEVYFSTVDASSNSRRVEICTKIELKSSLCDRVEG